MTKTVKNSIFSGFLALSVVLGVAFVGAPEANAVVVFTPCNGQTTMIGNFDTFEGIAAPCWGTSVSATSGQSINVRIYYYNTGSTTAQDVRIRMTKGGAGNNYVFSGSVSAANGGFAGGDSAHLAINSTQNQTINFVDIWHVPGNVNQGSLISTNESALLGSGISVGSVAPGQSGSLTIKYTVSNNTTPQVQVPTVTTNSYTAGQTSATLFGSYNANGSATERWFEYSTNASLSSGVIATQRLAPVTGSGSYQQNISGLAPGTRYYYRAVASNVAGTSYGAIKWFETLGTPAPQGSAPDVNNIGVTGLDENSVTLNGEYNMNNGTGRVWFEYDNSRSDVANGNGTQVTFTSNGTGTTWKNADVFINGLNDNTDYWFRICAENQYGSACDNGEFKFTTDEEVIVIVDPTVQTNSADDVQDDRAVLRGSYDMNDNRGDVFFVWTDSSSLRDELADVDLEAVRGDIDSRLETKTVRNNTSGSNSSVRETISGLADTTTHWFRLCVEWDEGIDCGVELSFTTENTTNSTNFLWVRTDGVIGQPTTTATLKGFYNLDVDATNRGVQTWFQYGLTSSLGQVTGTQIFGNDSTTFQQSIGNLQVNRTYYYRACASHENESTCGSVLTFYTGTVTPTGTITATTLAPSNIGTTTAVLNGRYTSDVSGSVQSTWFRYGRTTAFGATTSFVDNNNLSSSFSRGISGLSLGTRYYYQACASTVKNGVLVDTDCGNTLFFTTATDKGGPDPKPPVTPTGSFVTLSIENNETILQLGDTVTYDVEYGNVSGKTLEDVLVHVVLPKSLKFQNTTDGSYDRNENTVTVAVGDLRARETGDFKVKVRVTRGIEDGALITAQAVLGHDNPDTDARENAIAFDADVYDASGRGAGVWGAGFFPNTFLGWLLIALVLLILIIIARHYYLRGELTRAEREAMLRAAANGESVYQPYRPTPKA